MNRFLFMTAIRLMIVCMVGMGVVFVQRSDRAEFQALFLPQAECRSSCWLGLHFGNTPLTDVADILRPNPLIDSVETLSAQIHRIHFASTLPEIPQARMYLWADEDTFVEAMLLDTRIIPGDLIVLLGEPESVVLYRVFKPPGVSMFMLYPQYRMMTHISMNLCSPLERSAWEDARISSISIGDWQLRYPFYPLHYDQKLILDGSRWATDLRALRECE